MSGNLDGIFATFKRKYPETEQMRRAADAAVAAADVMHRKMTALRDEEVRRVYREAFDRVMSEQGVAE